jgi:DNA polymerase I-like protein with 3'-5' exonuclease and polymerase domains
MNLNRYTVLDLETTIKAPIPHFGAAPLWPSNKVVLLGYKHEGSSEIKTIGREHDAKFIREVSSEHRMLVGHNIPFDLLYLMRRGLHLANHTLWDTQKFFYIQRGRSPYSTSLEEVAHFYGVPFKKDVEIKERFKVGIGSDEIDEELLREYLIDDVETTEKIFLKQKEFCQGQCKYFERYMTAMMNSLIPTTQMTFNGIYFNSASAKAEMKEKESQLDSLTTEFIQRWTRDLPVKEFNASSPVQIGRRLWGSDLVGELSETVTEVLDEVYKSGARKGQNKTRQTAKKYFVKGLVSESTIKIFQKNKWKTDGSAQTIKRLKKHDAGEVAESFVADLESLRHLTKEISTYYKPYINYSISDILHPSFNHCVTATGRLSSSKPNFQNINGKKDL